MRFCVGVGVPEMLRDRYVEMRGRETAGTSVNRYVTT